MEQKKGVIEKIEKTDGISKTTGKPFLKYTYTIGGLLYSTFDTGIGESFKVGDSVVMDGQQNGKYWNMKTMRYANAEDGNIPVVKPGLAEKMQPEASKCENGFHLSPEQIRTNALNAALDFAGKEKANQIDIWHLVDLFEKYIRTGKRE